jgi:hypothetical protein
MVGFALSIKCRFSAVHRGPRLAFQRHAPTDAEIEAELKDDGVLND